MRLDDLEWQMNYLADLEMAYVGQHSVLWRDIQRQRYWLSSYGTERGAMDPMSAQCAVLELLKPRRNPRR